MHRLRLQRRSLRAMGSYKFPDTLADRTGSQICHCEEAAGRRGALSAKREEVPLGCNLGKAPPSRTGRR